MKEVQLKIRLSEDLREKVQAKAKEEDKSVNQTLVDLLTKYVEGQEEVKPKYVGGFGELKQVEVPFEYDPFKFFKEPTP